MSKSLLFAALAVISASFCFGQVPQTLSYQGLLTDNSGAPLTDGSYAVTFRFYSENGSLITSRGPLTVTTFKGLFTTVLGDETPDNIVNPALPFSLADKEFFVGITVSPSTTELAPRVKVTAVPYAFVAQVANSVPVGTTAQRPGSPVEGQIRYNVTEKVMEYYNGTYWYFMVPKVAFIKDVKPSGTFGGSPTNGTWMARDLNRTYGDVSFIVNLNTVTNGVFTLKPGEYIIEASAPSFFTNGCRIRLVNHAGLTDVGIEGNSYGTNGFGGVATAVQVNSQLAAIVSITNETAYQLQYYVSLGQGDTRALGWSLANGPEIYTQVKITKLR